MQDFWQALTTHPMTPWFGWFALGTLAIFWGVGQVRPHLPEDPIEKLQNTLGMEGVSGWFLTIAVLFWMAIFGVLFLGLLTLLADIAWNAVLPETREEKADFRFLLTKTTALTAVLAAVIAVPFTIVRIKLTAEQNQISAKQTQNDFDALYKDKLGEAVESLHSKIQRTTHEGDVWQDDIIRRNGAIDRLEALAVERPSEAPRIARTLSVYLRELTREYPAESAPSTANLKELEDWSHNLKVKRSDMEAAAQVLGRLSEKTGVHARALRIDLSEVNLQAMRLSNLNFDYATLHHSYLDGARLFFSTLRNARCFDAKLNGASLLDARLDGADFDWAELRNANLDHCTFDGAQFNDKSKLEGLQARGAALRNMDLSKISRVDYLTSAAFGDASVILPDDLTYPKCWPDQALERNEFDDELELFKEDPDSYVPPQHRNT